MPGLSAAVRNLLAAKYLYEKDDDETGLVFTMDTVAASGSDTAIYFATRYCVISSQEYNPGLVAPKLEIQNFRDNWPAIDGQFTASEIVVHNADGRYDTMASTYSPSLAWTERFAGELLTVKVGAIGWAIGSFGTLIKAVVGDVEYDRAKTVWTLDYEDLGKRTFPKYFPGRPVAETKGGGHSGGGGSIVAQARRPHRQSGGGVIQDDFYDNTVSKEVEGKPKPLTYGHVLSIEPVNYDETNRKYKVHEGDAIEDVVDAYEDGLQLTGGGTHYTEDLANGLFTKVTDATGIITADVKGAKVGTPTPAYIDLTAEIIEEILTTHGRGVYTINSSAVSTYDTDYPYSTGVFIREDENFRDVVSALLRPFGFYYFAAGYDFKVELLPDLSSASADHTLNPEDIIDFTCHSSQIFVKRVKLFFAPNYKTLDQFAGAVTTAEQNRQKMAWREVQDTDSAPTPGWPSTALDPLELFANITSETDADTVLTAAKARFGGQHWFYEVEYKPKKDFIANIEIGDVVTLKTGRHELESSGQKFVCLGRSEDWAKGRFIVYLWR